MTKVDYTECDICGEKITEGGFWAKFRRPFWFRAVQWGLVDLAPADTGWRLEPFDICGDCWDELLAVVRERRKGVREEIRYDE